MISTPNRWLSKKRQSFGEMAMGLFRPANVSLTARKTQRRGATRELWE
jgi:hypothetical protein